MKRYIVDGECMEAFAMLCVMAASAEDAIEAYKRKFPQCHGVNWRIEAIEATEDDWLMMSRWRYDGYTTSYEGYSYRG